MTDTTGRAIEEEGGPQITEGDDKRSVEEFQQLEENRLDIERALQIKTRVDYSFLVLVSFELTVWICYLIVFLVMDDHEWFDWMEFIHLFLAVVFILCLVDTSMIFRNLKYVIVIGLITFSVDIIISAYLRPLSIDHANPLNVRKIDQKRALLGIQILLTILDFTAIVLAMYFRYGSGLEEGVYDRYKDINLAWRKYMKTAIMLSLSNAEVAILRSRDEIQKERALAYAQEQSENTKTLSSLVKSAVEKYSTSNNNENDNNNNNNNNTNTNRNRFSPASIFKSAPKQTQAEVDEYVAFAKNEMQNNPQYLYWAQQNPGLAKLAESASNNYFVKKIAKQVINSNPRLKGEIDNLAKNRKQQLEDESLSISTTTASASQMRHHSKPSNAIYTRFDEESDDFDF